MPIKNVSTFLIQTTFTLFGMVSTKLCAQTKSYLPINAEPSVLTIRVHAKSIDQFAEVFNGNQLIDSYWVSTGRASKTPSGRYRVYKKIRNYYVSSSTGMAPAFFFQIKPDDFFNHPYALVSTSRTQDLGCAVTYGWIRMESEGIQKISELSESLDISEIVVEVTKESLGTKPDVKAPCRTYPSP